MTERLKNVQSGGYSSRGDPTFMMNDFPGTKTVHTNGGKTQARGPHVAQ